MPQLSPMMWVVFPSVLFVIYSGVVVLIHETVLDEVSNKELENEWVSVKW